jgi:methionyl-tRNA formyltransferase
VRLVFMGTPEFAVPTLQALASNHDVAAVITQPDRPAGRGRQLGQPPVKQAALELRLEVHQPLKIRTPEFHEFLGELQAEAFVVVGYGRILPQSIIDLPPRGIVNVHASLLPKYRGAAPIQWAVAQGETHTGVTTMRIDAGLDTGDILLRSETAIGPEETAVELSPRLASMGADLLLETLKTNPISSPQDHAQATYAPVLKKEDGLIDWSEPADKIHNRVRGFQPWPGCYTSFRGQLLRVWRTRPAGAVDAVPGSLHPSRNRLIATCGSGSGLELLEVQMQGRKRVDAAGFLNGQRVVQNELLGEMTE